MISEAIKPLQLVGQEADFTFESRFEPLPVIWQSLSKAVPEGNRRFRGQNQLGADLRHSWAGWTGKYKQRAFLSLLQSLWAATGSSEENMLPLLLY